MGNSSTLAAPVPSPQESLPSFEKWLIQKAKILTLPLLIAILNLVVSLASHFGTNLVPEFLRKDSLFTSHVLQACLIFILFLTVPKSFTSSNTDHVRAKAAAEDFRNAWQFTLFAWLILYTIFSVENSPLLKTDHPVISSVLHVLETAATCLSTLGFWRCFLTVSNPDQRTDYWKWLGIIFFLIAMKALSFKSETLNFVTNLSVGALAGVAMAFFVGRLESRLLRPPRWLLMALYCYAVLQFGYGFLEAPLKISVNWQPPFFFIVLLLKILLAFFASWLIGTGNLLFYLRFTSELNQDYADRRSTFIREAGGGS